MLLEPLHQVAHSTVDQRNEFPPRHKMTVVPTKLAIGAPGNDCSPLLALPGWSLLRWKPSEQIW